MKTFHVGPVGSILLFLVWLVGAVMIVKWIIEGLF